MAVERFCLHPDPQAARQAASALYAAIMPGLRDILPASARISHIGSTAVEGLQTKGDLDILVRVPKDAFMAADAALAARFPRNKGSVRTDDFSAFEVPDEALPVGIQLAAIDGAFDHFHLFAAALAAHPALIDGFNEIKQLFDGQPMTDYRAAKALFINAVLDGIARGEIPV